MQYHEFRIVAELRKQGGHGRAEDFRLKAIRPYAPSHSRAPGALGWHPLGLRRPCANTVRGRR
jgi:hypothetical protein